MTSLWFVYVVFGIILHILIFHSQAAVSSSYSNRCLSQIVLLLIYCRYCHSSLMSCHQWNGIQAGFTKFVFRFTNRMHFISESDSGFTTSLNLDSIIEYESYVGGSCCNIPPLADIEQQKRLDWDCDAWHNSNWCLPVAGFGNSTMTVGPFREYSC